MHSSQKLRLFYANISEDTTSNGFQPSIQTSDSSLKAVFPVSEYSNMNICSIVILTTDSSNFRPNHHLSDHGMVSLSCHTCICVLSNAAIVNGRYDSLCAINRFHSPLGLGTSKTVGPSTYEQQKTTQARPAHPTRTVDQIYICECKSRHNLSP